jgi:hypothetical protein
VAAGWNEDPPQPWGRSSLAAGEGGGATPSVAVEDLCCFGELQSTDGGFGKLLLWAMEKERAKSGEVKSVHA